jgi:Family of unknown function (DUF6069)
MATTMTANPAGATTRFGVSRALSVAGATVAAVAVWAIAVAGFGAHLTFRFGNGTPQTLDVGFVVAASLVGGALGWALLTLLERRTARARTIWTVAAIVVLLASLSLPLMAGVTVSTKVTLALMHLAVGAVLIPGLRRR